MTSPQQCPGGKIDEIDRKVCQRSFKVPRSLQHVYCGVLEILHSTPGSGSGI